VLASPVDVAAIRRIASGRQRGSWPLLVTACGTADHRKGVDLFVELAREVKQRSEAEIAFRWIGKVGSAQPAQPNDAGVVEFVGERDHALALIAECDVFVSTARADPFPLVVLEAMALAKPIVAFAVGGIPEQLGDAGRLVEPGDAERLRDAVLELAGDPLRRAELGRRALERVEALWDVGPFRVKVGELAAAAMSRSNASAGGSRPA
jgi:glycosyltransferase involved in cell wall biosynthesis